MKAVSENPFVAFPTPKTLLITGGTGFVGSHLIAQLLAAGHQVVLLTRRPHSVLPQWKMAKMLVVNNLDEIPQSQPIDLVINLAGARILGLPWTAARRKVLLNSRVGLTETLVNWLARREQKPELMISASAIGYYGIQHLADDTQLTEDAPAQNIFMSNLCSQWETAARKVEAIGIPLAITRFGVVLGNGGALSSLLLPIKLGLGGPLASGKQWMSWVHIEDLIRALAHVCSVQLQKPASLRIYNFTAPETLRQADFNRVAAKVLNRPYWFPTPGWPMKFLLGEQSQLLLEGQRVFPKALLDTEFYFRYPTLGSALTHLCLESKQE